MQQDVMKLSFNVLQELEAFINTKIGTYRVYKILESLNISIIASFFMSGEPPTYRSISDILNYDINGKNKMQDLLIELSDEQNIQELNDILSKNKVSKLKIVNQNGIYSISFDNTENEVTEMRKTSQYKSPYMQVLEWLICELKITEDNQDNFIKKNIISKLEEQKQFIKREFKVELSDKQIDMLATFSRKPQRGGNKG